MRKVRTILWDIEATNLRANFGFMLCVGWKVVGEKKIHIESIMDFPRYFKKDPTDDEQLAKVAHTVLSNADEWVTWYGKKFDVPYVNSRLLYHKHDLLPPGIKHIDGWWVSKYKLLLHSNRMAAVAQFLGKSVKTHFGGPTWIKAAAGNRKAIKYVEDHCYKDIIELENVYKRILPLIPPTHAINRSIFAGSDACPVCGVRGTLQKRGFTYARVTKKQKYWCKKCYGWTSGPSIRLPNIEAR